MYSRIWKTRFCQTTGSIDVAPPWQENRGSVAYLFLKCTLYLEATFWAQGERRLHMIHLSPHQ